jgi:hypothetical protein
MKDLLDLDYKRRIDSKIKLNCGILLKQFIDFEYKLFLATADRKYHLVSLPNHTERKRSVSDNEVRAILQNEIELHNLSNLFECFDIRFLWDSRINLLKYVDSLAKLKESIEFFVSVNILEGYPELEKFCFDFIQNADIEISIQEILWSVSEENKAKDNYTQIMKQTVQSGSVDYPEYHFLLNHLKKSKSLIKSIREEISKIE